MNNNLPALLDSAMPKLREVAVRGGVTAERVARLALAAINNNTDLSRCDPRTVLYSVLVAARLGLEPDGVLGLAYLVPYGGKCQLLIGYRGLMDLARRSGLVRKIESRVVYAGDVFEREEGLTPKLRHVPGDEETAWTHVYAIATLSDGSTQHEVMTRRQVMKIATGTGPWKQHETEMARKAVIRRLCKSLPLSVEMTAATQLLAGDEAGESKSEAAARVLEVDPDVRMIEARVEKPRQEAPTKRESVAEAKAKARQNAAPKPAPEPVKPDAGNRFRSAVAKLVAKGMPPEAAEDVATALFDGLESGAQHERVVAQSLREGLKIEVRDDSPTALLELIEGLS